MVERVRAVSELSAHDPARFGRHELLGRLGSGGMGVVYLAEGPLGLVALKVVREELASDSGFRTRFQREVQACFRVSGPWTARLLDFDTTASRPWLATEFIDSPDLQEAVESRGPLRPTAQADMALALAQGIASLHDFELVHRDLKPSNVLVTTDGPKIIDFGIASAIEDIGSLTATSNVVGSPAWMAPEQILEGESGMPSDVYAWGALVAFTASGRPLVTGKSLHDIMSKALTPDIAGHLEKVDARLRPTVLAALNSDPRQRPLAKDLVEALRPLATTRSPVPDPPDDPGQQTTKRIELPETRPDTSTLGGDQKSKKGLLIGGLVALLLAGGGLAVALSGSGGSHPTAGPSASQSASPATTNTPTTAPTTSPAASPTTSPTTSPAVPAQAHAFRPVNTEAELIARVPASIRPTCTSSTPSAPQTSQVVCRYDAPDGGSINLTYNGYKTAADLNADVGNGDKVAGGCVGGLQKFMAAKKFGGYLESYRDGTHNGLVDCSFTYITGDSYSGISWTDTSTSLRGFVPNSAGTEAAYQELYKTWLQIRHAS